jgi:hypothetical protein
MKLAMITIDPSLKPRQNFKDLSLASQRSTETISLAHGAELYIQFDVRYGF